jgi:hypothetical protein
VQLYVEQKPLNMGACKHKPNARIFIKIAGKEKNFLKNSGQQKKMCKRADLAHPSTLLLQCP